jgi:hypothetical protein
MKIFSSGIVADFVGGFEKECSMFRGLIRGLIKNFKKEEDH